MKFSISLVASLIVLSFAAHADMCFPDARGARNENFAIDAKRDHDADQWVYTLTDRRTRQTTSAPLTGPEPHSHLRLFPSKDGSHFAVLDLIAGHRHTNRIMLYTADGRLVVSLAIEDILATDELDTVTKSLSHIQWLEESSKGAEQGEYLPEEDIIEFTTWRGRKVRFSLADGRLSDTSPLLHFAWTDYTKPNEAVRLAIQATGEAIVWYRPQGKPGFMGHTETYTTSIGQDEVETLRKLIVSCGFFDLVKERSTYSKEYGRTTITVDNDQGRRALVFGSRPELQPIVDILRPLAEQGKTAIEERLATESERRRRGGG